MKVLITGGSGLIGSKITELLLKKNITVVHLTRHRNSKSGVKTYVWDWEKGTIDLKCFNEVTHIIHLAGAGIADKAWTTKRKRFLIKSMQLVGATQPFIRKPFVQKGVVHGIYSALIAILLIMGVMYYSQQYLPDLIQIQDIEILAYLFVIVMILGIVISWVSTSLAVRKFIRTRSDKLY